MYMYIGVSHIHINTNIHMYVYINTIKLDVVSFLLSYRNFIIVINCGTEDLCCQDKAY